MGTLWTIVVLAFVLGVLALVAYTVFELTPFAHHNEAGRGESPHLETRDEFEHRTTP